VGIPAIVALLAMVSTALATNYWGYNNMTRNSPVGACYAAPTHAGSACTSVTSVSDQYQATSGSACIIVWYYANGATAYQGCGVTTKTISAQTSVGYSPAAGAACSWVSGSYAYPQCRYFNGMSPQGKEYR
jgi:hypothetical protein